ncbi:hypothetical protein L345_13170, partial [Ophiophagus hannah]
MCCQQGRIEGKENQNFDVVECKGQTQPMICFTHHGLFISRGTLPTLLFPPLPTQAPWRKPPPKEDFAHLQVTTKENHKVEGAVIAVCTQSRAQIGLSRSSHIRFWSWTVQVHLTREGADATSAPDRADAATATETPQAASVVATPPTATGSQLAERMGPGMVSTTGAGWMVTSDAGIWLMQDGTTPAKVPSHNRSQDQDLRSRIPMSRIHMVHSQLTPVRQQGWKHKMEQHKMVDSKPFFVWYGKEKRRKKEKKVVEQKKEVGRDLGGLVVQSPIQIGEPIPKKPPCLLCHLALNFSKLNIHLNTCQAELRGRRARIVIDFLAALTETWPSLHGSMRRENPPNDLLYPPSAGRMGRKLRSRRKKMRRRKMRRKSRRRKLRRRGKKGRRKIHKISRLYELTRERAKSPDFSLKGMVLESPGLNPENSMLLCSSRNSSCNKILGAVKTK